ncbi:MAG: DeoR/GlpR family DNA-binding transcription regulator [Spirochaetota bacterium]
MALPDRHEDILRILELRERVSVSDLTDRLGVSEVTVRKDLSILEEQGHLVRTRGGARLAQDRARLEPIDRRMAVRSGVKEAIAAAAAALVREGETIYVDSGTTCLAFAREIRDMDLRVVTNSLDVLSELSHATSIVIYGVGGSFRRDARSYIGPLAVEAVRRFHFDRAFLGTSGLTVDGVFSSQNAIESEVKRAVIGQAARIVVLTDSSKVGQSAFSIFARPEQVHMVVTDGSPAAAALSETVPFEVVMVSRQEEQ